MDDTNDDGIFSGYKTRIIGERSEYEEDALEEMAEREDLRVEAYELEDGRYALGIVFEGVDTAEQIMDVYNNVLKDMMPTRNLGVLASSQSAKEEMVVSDDTFGLADPETEDWAYDVERALTKYGVDEGQASHVDTIQNINASFLATLSHAMDEDLSGEGIGFYQDLVQGEYGIQPEEPVVIDVEEESQGPSYSEIVSGTIKEAKNRLSEVENPDWEELLEAEKEGKDRKSFKRFISRKMDG